ncbi:MAG TPA: tetratricopeptide repeat protein [Fimbriimonadaceae bacterium]|nr:tetratricopeptide repeat protein [Fimbriimonadaceae bacterium]HRJ97721.1 tetratricopeptide repeat protein [Fimbriimonadaceae bacterium]
MAPPQGLERRRLASALWPGTPEPAALQSLRKALQHVRQALGPEARHLHAEGDRLRLDRTGLWIDAVALESASDSEVAELYRGPLGGPDAPDLAEEEVDALWDSAWDVRLAERSQSAHLRLAREALDAGDRSLAEQWFERALRTDTTDEAPYLGYMRLLDEAGRPEEAVRIYRRLVAALAAQGLAVSAEVIETAKSIRKRIRRVHRAIDKSESDHPAWVAVQTLQAAQNPLVGRAEAMEALRDRLGGARVVTVTGAGGLGKTRLAIEVASELGHERHFGAVWVDLTTIPAEGDPAEALAASLGQSTPLDLTYLAATDALIVLDNCEHVLERAATLARESIRRCPRITILATSREPLGLPTESRMDLDPLDEEATLRLYQGRVKQWGGRDSRSSQEVLEQTGGMPLAIELLASQSRGIDPEALKGHMPDRHRSLEAVVEASLEECDEETRRLLACLSLIPGSFGIAETVAASGLSTAAVVPMLDQLERRSLLIRSGEDYRILPTIRQVVEASLPAEERVEALLRLAAHARELAKAQLALTAVRQAELPGRISSRMALFRMAFQVYLEHDPAQAFALATDLSLGMARLGRAAEGLAMLEQAQAFAASGAPIDQALASLAMGNLCKELGLSRRALAVYAEAESLFAGEERYRGAGACCINASFVHTDLGEYDEARAALARAESFFDAYAPEAPPDDLAFARLNVFKSAARIALHRREAAEGRRIGCEGLALAREIGDMHSAAVILTNLGDTELLEGEHEAAELWLRESLKISAEIGDTAAIAFTHAGLGLAAIAKASPEEAKEHLREAIRMFAAADQKRDLLMAMTMAAALAEDGVFLRLASACRYHRERLGYAFSPAMAVVIDPLYASATERVGPVLAPRYERLGEGTPIGELVEEAKRIVEHGDPSADRRGSVP